PFEAITDINISSVKDIDCATGEDISVKTVTNIDNVTYAITSAPAGYSGPTSETVTPATDAALTFTNLPTGTYTITATHPTTGCVFEKTYTVGSAPSYTVIANNAQATCFGVAGGSIDVFFDASTPFNGATDVYDYVVFEQGGTATTITGTGINGGTTETITGLPEGTYYVAVTMTNTPFCTINTNEFTINEPTAILSVTGVVTKEVSCENDSDATITATGADGFGGYTYQLEVTGTPNVPYRAGDAFATNTTNNVFTGLPAGSYTIRVRDVNDCEGASTAVVVSNPDPVSFTAVDTDNACDTSVGGSIL
ncbi:hypothetical protein, partial [Tenacibaculum soleae]|uniref:hypothetical protein n=1 Tax=Tenacibaculum soleae TaxID=447689 RepID=UPI003B8A9925